MNGREQAKTLRNEDAREQAIRDLVQAVDDVLHADSGKNAFDLVCTCLADAYDDLVQQGGGESAADEDSVVSALAALGVR